MITGNPVDRPPLYQWKLETRETLLKPAPVLLAADFGTSLVSAFLLPPPQVPSAPLLPIAPNVPQPFAITGDGNGTVYIGFNGINQPTVQSLVYPAAPQTLPTLGVLNAGLNYNGLAFGNVLYATDPYGVIWQYDNQTQSFAQLAKLPIQPNSYLGGAAWDQKRNVIWVVAGVSIYGYQANGTNFGQFMPGGLWGITGAIPITLSVDQNTGNLYILYLLNGSGFQANVGMIDLSNGTSSKAPINKTPFVSPGASTAMAVATVNGTLTIFVAASAGSASSEILAFDLAGNQTTVVPASAGLQTVAALAICDTAATSVLKFLVEVPVAGPRPGHP